MLINSNKAIIGNRYYDTYTKDYYLNNEDIVNYQDNIAIQTPDYILPLKKGTVDGPGVYEREAYLVTVLPETEEEKNMYSINNMINFSDVSSMEEYCQRNNLYHQMERVMLTTVDNCYVPIRNDDDEPAMTALKDAIESKGIDISKYQSRFGPNYTNDLRLLQKSRITLSKLVTIAENLDISAELILRDKNPDVANPMNKEIHANLIGGGDEIGSEETTS